MCGLGLRVAVNGAQGFSSTSDFSRLPATAEAAVRAARVRGGDPDWKGLARPDVAMTVQGTYDPVLAQMEPEEVIKMAMQLLEGCASVSFAQPLSGGVGLSCGVEVIASSAGMDLREIGTACHGSLEAVSHGDTVATGSEFDMSRSHGLDMVAVGMKAAQMAASSRGGVAAPTGTFQVVLSPVAFADLLGNTFVPALSAESVQKGRSRLADKIGQIVADPHLSLVDDGLLPGGMGTSSTDAEGVSSQRTVLVDSGVMKGFLYDSYCAGKEGLHSTGNSVRGGYFDLPKVGLRNLLILSEEPVDILADLKEGLYASSLIGAHTGNPISGDFSVEARNAFLVKDGELAEPVRSAMLAGNIFQIMSELKAGKDSRAVGGIVTPTVRAPLKVVG